MKQSGNCSNCARGVRVKVNSDILCRIHGAVSSNYRCSRYIRKVATWSTSSPLVPSEAEHKTKCIECEFFVSPRTTKEHNPAIGYCELFTVRNYNGQTKNACSKFRKKDQKNIS